MDLKIDNRELQHHPNLYAKLHHFANAERKFKVNIINEMMPFADYIWTGAPADWLPDADGNPTCPTIGLELCSISDLMEKIKSGRLGNQLSAIRTNCDFAILLIESPIYANKDGYVNLPGGFITTKWEYADLTSVLFSAQMHGVSVCYARSRDTVADTIWQMITYWQKGYDDHHTFRTTTPKPHVQIPLGDARDKKIEFLMGLPMIGEDKATKALAYAGDLQTFFDIARSEPMLSAFPGWGAGSAKTVAEFLKEPF